ncbi:MAG: right-handed parallel beta-helix repeat-containing protein [Phycisphaerae bacterium]|nr:right-handed parallel beta-helix repeat-containing protein [Phycisphaerae bacterium]
MFLARNPVVVSAWAGMVIRILAAAAMTGGPGCAEVMAAEADKVHYYVAPTGKDTNPGTAAEPFATVGRARDEVRKRIAGGLDRDIVVLIRGGTYPQTETLAFGPEDSGTDTHSITYAAAPGEKVVLSGGRAIAGWKRGPGTVWTAELPEVRAGKWYFRQLFVAGRRAIRARTPNRPAWWKLVPRPDNSDANGATITLGVDHPIGAWKNVSDVEVIWLNNNDASRKRLGSVRQGDNTFTLPPPHQWPHGLPVEYNIGFPSKGFPCYFENALEMLDEPGEWYLDRSTSVLSYWPREGEDLTRDEVIAPLVQSTLLAIRGTPERPVRNLHFQGIRVTYVDWPLPAYGFTSMFGCLQVLEQSDPPGAKKMLWIDAAVSFRHARGCNFTRGAVEHAGAIGLSLLNGCAENVIEGNDLHDLGGGGITAGQLRNRDTWKWADPLGKDDHKGYRIANNHIHDCGADYIGAVGICAVLTQDVVIAHNLIHDISYAGIVLSGNETPEPDYAKFAKSAAVEYNHIHDVLKVAVDGAGIYASFPHAGSGAAIRGNLIHDLRPNPSNPREVGPWSAAGIYLDGVRPQLGCRDYRIEDNLVYKTTAPLFFCACGPEGNHILNNVFLPAGVPAKESLEAAQSRAGLEPAYRRALLGASGPPG